MNIKDFIKVKKISFFKFYNEKPNLYCQSYAFISYIITWADEYSVKSK